MKLIACIDEQGGMFFNHRRQSRDRIQQKHMMNITGREIIRMTDKSAHLFAEEYADRICITESVIDACETDDWYFAETEDVREALSFTDCILLYCWNRAYPSDCVFPLEWLRTFKKVNEGEFKGSSHDSITWEVYVR